MIYWFSGTGNSRRVAQHLAQLLGDGMAFMTPGLKSDHERVIWVFPIYSWGVPPYVAEVIRTASLAEGSRHYMVATCGDDAGLAPQMWRKLLEPHHVVPMAAYTVIMPNTYVVLPGFDVDPPELRDSKLEQEPERTRHIARLISESSTTDDFTTGSMPWIKTRLIYPWFIAHMMSPRDFKVSDACISCGRCSRDCPVSNISMDEKGRPVWGDRCAGCLACYHVCPAHAISFGRFTASKGQYYLENP
ncbi:MAG: EFR1 family ferrodoxin [Lachnoclostridium sp.]|nr:EFR1 family ferrodoxin [Lachnoclostridium sp.]